MISIIIALLILIMGGAVLVFQSFQDYLEAIKHFYTVLYGKDFSLIWQGFANDIYFSVKLKKECQEDFLRIKKIVVKWKKMNRETRG